MIQWGRTWHYRINGFCPPSDSAAVMAMWGFSVELDADFARAAKAVPLPEGYREQLQSIAAEWGPKCCGFSPISGEQTVNFWEDTLLLTNVSVPGNACGLDIDRDRWRDLDRGYCGDPGYLPKTIEYHPHNVDSMGQASGLLAIWLQWFTNAYATLSEPL